ncbi:MAG TPA: glycerol-3-phosphate 1-O-acyltransferase PlsY [Candidatus Limnocylindrales bacterium]|nr:glycerol-3-phosphate 1-O-acyltransferase PlsY [Candidatus Limnocylindrales bacterium]
MTGVPGTAGVIGLGYLVGAIPFGVLAGWLAGGVDLRRQGSRRTGATNALRTLGMRWALVVLVLDIAKGAAAVLLARLLFQADGGPDVAVVAATAGLAAVVGHTWSAFIGFRGGRGVATTAGGLLVLAPLAVAVLVVLVLAVAWRTRYVSAGSLAGATAAPLVTGALAVPGLNGWPAVGYALATGLLVVISHRDNIARLRAGTERRIGEREAVGDHEQG